MKTKQGNNTATLLSIHTGYKVLSLQLKDDLQGDLPSMYLPNMVDMINNRLASGEKPAATFTKQLERIEHHKEQLIDAYKELWACYGRLIEPQKRTSPIDTTRKAMLEGIPDMKLLRQMCALHLTVDKAADYILPDDKGKMIQATVEAMKTVD